jgi:TolB-like protein
VSDRIDGGSFEIWPAERQLLIHGEPVAIGARAFDVLLALVDRRDGVVSKTELLDVVWPELDVEENNLSVQISTLRRLLGPAAIVTVPGRGYRLVLPTTQASGTPPPVVPLSNRPAVAVLPFDAHRPDDAYFGEGITEEIIAALSANHGLFVIARNSSLRYRGSTSSPQQIATELGVRYLVYGSVRRLAKTLRIGAELVEAATGRDLWADHFEGSGEDLFEFQTRIAARLSAAIDAGVEEAEIASAAKRPTRMLSAYDCVLRALGVMHSFSDGGFDRAGDLLRRAIEIDPGYTRAHAHLAWWHTLKVGEGRSPEDNEDGRLAMQLSRRAIELDARDALALSVAGHVESYVCRNFDAAMDLFGQALSIQPSCTVAWGRSAATLAYGGQAEEALRRVAIAMRLSPFDPFTFAFCTTHGTACLILGRDDEAATWLAKARRLSSGYRAAWRLLVAALALAGRVDEARAQADAFLRAEPGFRISAFGARYPLQPKHLSRILGGMRRAGLPE